MRQLGLSLAPTQRRVSEDESCERLNDNTLARFAAQARKQALAEVAKRFTELGDAHAAQLVLRMVDEPASWLCGTKWID